MQNKYNKLAKNTAIIAIGSFGSKILTFLIIPLYTYVLSQAEYGIVDLFTTTMSLLIPISTLLIQEAIIRFLAAKEYDEITVVNNSFAVFVGGSVFLIIVIALFGNLFAFRDYLGYFTVFVIVGGYNRIFSETLRAKGKLVFYSIYGVIGTAGLVFLNLLFLLFFKWGIVGYFRALVASELLCAIYITFAGGVVRKINAKKIDVLALKKMLKYCIPLIPNNIMWWIMNAGDKYIINYFLGDEANGIYSLSMKIPTILTTLFTIFIQAWQLSAIEEKDSNSRGDFYSKVFYIVSAFVVLGASFAALIAKPLFVIAISSTFFEAWKYVPILCLATTLNCIASFCGITYVVNKKSYKATFSTAIAAGVNLFCNFILVQLMGLYGIAVGTCIGYCIVMIIRMIDTKKEFNIDFKIIRFTISIGILLLQANISFYLNGTIMYVVSSISLIILMVLYYREIFELIKKAFRMTRRKRMS